jgi:hypothetical protein
VPDAALAVVAVPWLVDAGAEPLEVWVAPLEAGPLEEGDEVPWEGVECEDPVLGVEFPARGSTYCWFPADCASAAAGAASNRAASTARALSA